jgi:hypothetical protein
VGEERRHNPRLGDGKTLAEFRAIMADLRLAPPRQIAVALPANLRGGVPLRDGDVGHAAVAETVRGEPERRDGAAARP